jgi:hypothetical protein
LSQRKPAIEVLVEFTMPELKTRISEEAMELNILKAVSTAARHQLAQMIEFLY